MVQGFEGIRPLVKQNGKQCRDVAVLRLYKGCGQRIFNFQRGLIMSAKIMQKLSTTLIPSPYGDASRRCTWRTWRFVFSIRSA